MLDHIRPLRTFARIMASKQFLMILASFHKNAREAPKVTPVMSRARYPAVVLRYGHRLLVPESRSERIAAKVHACAHAAVLKSTCCNALLSPFDL